MDPFDPVRDPVDMLRRLQIRPAPTLAGCTDAELEAEARRRAERREQQVKEAIKLVKGAGYTVVKGAGG